MSTETKINKYIQDAYDRLMEAGVEVPDQSQLEKISQTYQQDLKGAYEYVNGEGSGRMVTTLAGEEMTAAQALAGLSRAEKRNIA